MNVADAGAPPLQLTAEEQQQVLLQMDRLLESPLFKNSRRYPALLRFLVNETLEGRGEFLKERLLGIRVFDRPADYDTAADPIVRVTVAEVRKRIAQYYHDEQHDAEIRIELLPGRYVPEFRRRRETITPTPAPVPHAQEPAPLLIGGQPSLAPPQDLAVLPPARRKRSLRLGLYALCGILLLAVGTFVATRWLRPTAVEQVWSPFFNSPHSLLLCLPTDIAGKKAQFPGDAAIPTGQTFRDHEWIGENVVYSDMLATLSIAGVFAGHHHEYATRLTRTTTLEDLRHEPAILIGGLDNQWTMRALSPLRYRFAGNDDEGYYILDATQPNNRAWSLNLKQQYATVTRDYAIIARLHSEQTGQPTMLVAGIGMSGTAAAGDFLADEQALTVLRQKLGRNFKDRDFEVVLSTDVVSGIAGSPKILAVELLK